MAQVNRDQLRKKDFAIVKDRATGKITNVIAPNGLQVGLDSEDFRASLTLKGPVLARDGTPWLVAGSNVTLTTGSNNAVTITASPGSAGDLTGAAADGIVNFSYNGESAATVKIDLFNNTGLQLTSFGLAINPTEASELSATPANDDYLLIHDTSVPGSIVKKISVSNLMAAASSLSSLGNKLSFGDGLEGSSGESFYNNSAAVTLRMDLASNGGLGITGGVGSGGELYVDPSTATTSSAAANDSLIIYDQTAGATRKIAVQQVANFATVGVLNNPLTVGNGLGLNSGTTFDGSANKTLTATAANSTISVGASGISVASVPNALTAGNGITTFSYNGGTASVTVSVDLDSDGGLGINGGELTLDYSNLNIDDITLSDYFSFYDTSGGVSSTSRISLSNFINFINNKIDWASNSGDPNAKYLVLSSTGSLTAERVFNPSTGLIATDSGAGNNYTLQIDYSGAGNIISAATDGTSITVDANNDKILLYDNNTSTVKYINVNQVQYATGGGGGDAAAEYLVLSATGSLTSERVFTAGTGLSTTDGGAGSTYTISVNNSIIATLTGSTFSGVVKAPAFSGSLTRLNDGTSYLVAGNNITVTSGSNGAITIASTGTDTTYSAGDGLDLSGTVFSTDLKSSGGLKIDSTELAVDNSIVATLTGSQFSGNVGIAGSLQATGGISGSLTQLNDGTSYLVAGNNISITTGSSGAVTVASSGGDITISSGSTSISSVTTINFSNSGIIQNLGSGVVAITGSIGPSEDGTYTDGLFTDFTTVTPVGTAVDRFNEVLKGLAPSAAPSLDDADCSDSGNSAVLSFGSSQSISGYTNAQPSTLTPTDNLSDININGTFSSTIVSNDTRVACFDGATVINGILNADVAVDSPNYAADSFGNGNQGTLYLYVNNNSTAIHSVDLSSFGSGNSLNGNSSGFNLSAVTNGAFSDGTSFDTFKHRTGTYIITAANQRNGWNYARITHVVGSSTTTTNYIEWVNDSNSNALSSDNSAMDSLSMTGTKNLSGVKYNTGGSAQYRIRALNAYRNVYSTSNISFNGTNCSVSSQAFPSIDYAGGENESKVLHVTGSATITGDPILNGSITVSTNVPHPLKSNLSSAGSQSISGILLYNLSNTSTVTSETFRAENYRRVSGSYDNQAAATSGGNAWDSTTSLLTVDGLMFYNSRLYAPVQGGVSGDFRNTSDGGSIANGPSSNLNYSTITSGLRTFYRYFQNNSGGSQTGFSLTINGSGTIASQPTSLSTSNLHVLIKLPTTGDSFETGWMDLAVAFATGQTSDGDGCLQGSFDSSLNASNTATFGTQSVGDNEYVIVKIEADASFTGYISSMSVSWS